MAALKGRVGKREVNFTSVPHGTVGSARAEVDGVSVDVRWRKDENGIWIETSRAIVGFDIEAENGDDGRRFYHLSQRGLANEWKGLSFIRSGEESAGSEAAGRKKGIRIRAQMPGKIIRVLVRADDNVEKDQALFVMEAMKMENEIRSPHAGKVGSLKVNEGQAVETGAELCQIDTA